MGSFTDFSQLRKFKPAEPEPAAPPPPAEPEDRALAAAGSSTDYFSSLLGASEPRKKPKPATGVPELRTTVVTPATVARVREEQAEAARAAERAAFEAREAALQEDLAIQKTVSEDLAADLASVRLELESAGAVRDALETERARLEAENRRLADELAAERAAPRQDPALASACAEKDRALAAQAEEIARLKTLLAEAQRTSLSSSVLLEKPATFSEKFAGELREHVVEAIADAVSAAEAGGRDRRARILEAVLVANPASGDLDRRREAVKQIVKEAGSRLDDAAIADLEKLGFRYVSGNKHHKLEWAGIRFPLAKTPSDYRSCLNSAAEICNRVF